MIMDSVFFLDSVDSIWETCNPDDNDACAFGPRGCARKLDKSLIRGFKVTDDEAGFKIVEIW
jgi:hypothetical protein